MVEHLNGLKIVIGKGHLVVESMMTTSLLMVWGSPPRDANLKGW
ncbi:hypothetical protein [Providencia vermicola]